MVVYNGVMGKAGYEFLLAYKITNPVYDYAVAFADKYISRYSRSHDQWIQAARSGTQNNPQQYKKKFFIYEMRL